ncbi:MAG: hypothetical protein RLZZ495_460 [Pseudomonadota bacterium]|jgi:hypothetical protein
MANLFRRPDYQSDATQFLNQLNQNDPELAARRLAARSTLWEPKMPEPDFQTGFSVGRVAQKPYVYFSNEKTDS